MLRSTGWVLGFCGVMACGGGDEPAEEGAPNLPDPGGGAAGASQQEPSVPAAMGDDEPSPGVAGSTGETINPELPLGTPPPEVSSVPGVVVVDSGAARCAALCTVTLTVAADPDGNGDDWSYENAASCVIPESLTGRGNQPCMTGAPLPAERQIPGVVVVDNQVPRCAPLCLLITDSALDPDGTIDGWFYENNLSCVIGDSVTARANQPCTTGGALPTAEPRPGILVADGLDAACRPVCQVATGPSSPDAPDWGYEQNASCVLPGSATALGSSRSCTFGGPVLELVPPALPESTVAPGFFVQAGRLRDAYGADFVIRGVNNPHIWYDSAAQYDAYLALDTIASYGTNTIRVVWDTTGPVRLLREILYRIVELGMVPMVELHDATGESSRELLLDMAEYHARPDVRAVLDDFRQYALVNIANEWSGNDFFASYQAAITYLRANGVNHTLVIDANGFGQNGQALLDNAAALTNADPQRNLLFSVHMYERFATPAAVDALLNAAAAGQVPLVVGEFGWRHNGQNVAWERILSRTDELGVGYIAWSWLGNDAATAELDMAVDWSGPLSDWGSDVLEGAPGNIRATSERASIFD